MIIATRFNKFFNVLWAGIVLLALSLPATAQNRDGNQIYQQFCSSCHGANLEGGAGSSFVDGEWNYGESSEELIAIVKNGITEKGMPPFSASLSDEEIENVVAFIRSGGEGSSAQESASSDTLQTLDYVVKTETYIDGLDTPWGIEFLNDRVALITERSGNLWMAVDGRLLDEPVAGTPAVIAEGQGGLLDVTADPDFSRNGWVYLSYSHGIQNSEQDTVTMTRVVRGKVNDNQWVDQEVVFEAPHDTYRSTRHHYGSRIVFEDGYLYFSIGDRGRRPQAQDLSLPNGKIHRVFPDGSIPEDNPFVDNEDALPSIFSYGHRNPQGLTVHPETGHIWDGEHGPRGGDELNRVAAGNNYGWPEITYGIHYSGEIMTRNRVREGMEQPNFYWRPSIAISGIHFYDKDMFPFWKNRLLVGALAYQEVRLLNIHEDRVTHEEVILKDEGRVREAIPGPDGAIYVVLNEPGKIMRISKVRESLQ